MKALRFWLVTIALLTLVWPAAAQDTGSAIVGPARGDLFMGSGEAAGNRAGAVRSPAEFFVLVPKSAPVDLDKAVAS